MTSRGRGVLHVTAVLVGGLLVTTTTAQQALVTFAPAGQTTTLLGTSLATLPDRDGDGLDELVVGEPVQGFGGAIQVVSSGSATSLQQLAGPLFGDAFGTSMARLLDVDGDGVDDLLVGGPQVQGGRPGYVEVLSGVDLSSIVRLDGMQDDSGFGSAVASLGDLDGDGSGDFAVGAPFENGVSGQTGVVRVYSGGFGAPTVIRTHEGAVNSERLGAALACAGDVDGDGTLDLIGGTSSMGPLNAPDYARVWSGADGSVLLDLPADAPGDHFGSAVAGVGDVDVDGHGDVLVGAWGFGPTDVGLARLVSGADGSTLDEWFGSEAGDRLGETVSATGDVDGDGRPDLALSVTRPSQPAPGEVRVYSGRDGSLLDLHVGGAAGDEFGRSVVSAGDVDGDGRDEIAVGAPRGGGNAAGVVQVFSHVPVTRTPLLFALCELAGARAGSDVAAGADLDGDGVDDVVLGGPSLDTLDDGDVGVVQARSGADGTFLWERRGTLPFERVGEAVALLGDTDGDGVSDVACSGGPGVLILSGADGSELRSFGADGLPGDFGSRLEPAGDHDGDGFGDVLVGSGVFFGQGAVAVHSGATGARLLEILGPDATNTRFGAQGLASLGDLTGDGVPDYVVGDDSYDDAPGQPAGSGALFLYSGADGAPLGVIPGRRFVDRLGVAVAALPDQDGDGRPDVAAVAVGQFNFSVPAELRVYDTRDGTELMTHTVAGSVGSEVVDLVRVGDVEGDGVEDLALSLPQASLGGLFNGRVDVVPATGGPRLFALAGPPDAPDSPPGSVTNFGASLAVTGDRDGDGVGELVVGARFAGADDGGGAYVIVSRDLTWRGVGPGLELAGALGTPALVATGELLGGDPLEVSLAGAAPGASAWLVVGLGQLGLPFKGGTLVPTLDLLLPLAVDGQGFVSLATTWPTGLPAGVEVVLQGWVAEAAGPAGFAASNALVALTPGGPGL